MREILDGTRLLSRQEFEALFPDCRIITERLWWVLPKGYIAVRDGGLSGPLTDATPPKVTRAEH
jgi:hypothetical protein